MLTGNGNRSPVNLGRQLGRKYDDLDIFGEHITNATHFGNKHNVGYVCIDIIILFINQIVKTSMSYDYNRAIEVLSDEEVVGAKKTCKRFAQKKRSVNCHDVNQKD